MVGGRGREGGGWEVAGGRRRVGEGGREMKYIESFLGDKQKRIFPSLIYYKSFTTKQMFVILKNMHINSRIHY